MAFGRYDFGIDQNADLTLPFNLGLQDPSGDPTLISYPYVFTGAVLRCNIRAAQDSSSYSYGVLSVGSGITLTTVTLSGTTVAPSAPNGFSLTFANAITGAFPNGALLYYDVMQAIGSLNFYWLSGFISVGTTVTR